MQEKKILLVSPKRYINNYSDLDIGITSFTKKPGGFLCIQLATVAALTPPGFTIRIIDENIEPIDFNEPYDLVGITGFFSTIPRAEEIARKFLKKGTVVVCGGPSVSLETSRWRPFADVLIIGEAERTWPQFLNDYLDGDYKVEYRETEKIDLSITPLPDFRGLLKKQYKKYSIGIVQIARGCPYNCEYCSIISYTGRKTRYKPVENIINELDQLYEMGPYTVIFLASDNFSAHPVAAKKILKALGDWNEKGMVTFITEISIDIADDEEFLQLAARANLTRFFIGIETPNIQSLKEAGKNHNIKVNMSTAVKKIQQYGILVFCGSLVGFDHDDISIFTKQLDFYMNNGIPYVQVHPLQAADGTKLKERMVSQNRYIDWESTRRKHPDTSNILNTLTIIPKNMTPDQMKQGHVLAFSTTLQGRLFHGTAENLF